MSGLEHELETAKMESSEHNPDVLSELHSRYLLLSGRFKSAWTYHQFLKGVNKVFAENPLQIDTQSFQTIYSELKTASKNLNVAGADEATARMDQAEAELEDRLLVLLEADAQLTPALLRRFFKRVRNYDARILGQLLKFYLFTRENAWDEHRLDKADYLLTRLGELLLETDRDLIERRPHALRDALRGLWHIAGVADPDEAAVAHTVATFARLQDKMRKIETLEDFHQQGLIQDYRDAKRESGLMFFHPEVAQRIVEINLFLAQQVETLYGLEEQRVATEYNRVFELEREASHLEDSLDSELRRFRTDVESYEKSLEGQDMKIDQVVQVSERARGLIPKLEILGSSPDHLEASKGAISDAVPELFAEPDTDQPLPPLPEQDLVPSAAERSVAGDASTDEPAHEESDEEPLPEAEEAGLASTDSAATRDGELEPASSASDSFARLAPPGTGIPANWRDGLSGERPRENLRIRTGYAEQLGEVLRQVLQVLENTDWEMRPRLVTQVPEVRPLRLEPREVLAYRRLFFPDRFPRSMEQFLVESAALRVLLGYQAEELVELLDESENARTGALHGQALTAVELASEFERRFQHFLQNAVLERNLEDAAALQLLWMRLLREYSGLWLLLHR